MSIKINSYSPKFFDGNVLLTFRINDFRRLKLYTESLNKKFKEDCTLVKVTIKLLASFFTT